MSLRDRIVGVSRTTQSRDADVDPGAVGGGGLVDVERRLKAIDQRIRAADDRQAKASKRLMRRVVKLEEGLAGPRGIGDEPGFQELAEPVIIEGRTMLGVDRLHVLFQAVRNAPPSADVAEIGTYRGGSAAFLAAAFRQLHGTDVRLQVMDTFLGHLPATLGERDPSQRAGKFADTDRDEVAGYLSSFAAEVLAGDATADLGLLGDRRYGFVHVDTDLYEPTLACLRYFGARMLPGAILVLDDFRAERCPGVEDAWLTYRDDDASAQFQVWDFRTEQLVLVRP